MWVIDTSAVTQIRREIPEVDRKQVFVELSARIAAGTLCYPAQVFDEMERGESNKGHDQGYAWVKRHKSHCRTHEPLSDHVKQAFSVPLVQRVLDPNKDHEEADPYVLALALKLQEVGVRVVVITQDERSRPDKLSLRDACGLLRIVSISTLPFLEQEGIYPVKSAAP